MIKHYSIPIKHDLLRHHGSDGARAELPAALSPALTVLVNLFDNQLAGLTSLDLSHNSIVSERAETRADLTPQPAASASASPPPVQQPPRPGALPARRRPTARATARRPHSSSFYPFLAGLTTLTTTRPMLRIPCAKAYSRPPTRTTHKNSSIKNQI